MTNPEPNFVLRIDLHGPVPVYRQVVDGLRAALVGGAFRPGDKLPTVRDLAVDLGVNHNTIAQAYRLLAEEGWIELRRYHGAVVIPRQAPSAQPEQKEDFIQRLREVTARAIAQGLSPLTISEQLRALATELAHSRKTLL